MIVDFFQELHLSTVRDHLARVTEDKWKNCIIAKKFSGEYWTSGSYGYQNYAYDGRHLPIAHAIADHYQLSEGMKVLDVGCGMGFLLHDLEIVVPGLELYGCDISRYALERSKVKNVVIADAGEGLPYPNRSFDLILSVNTLHNLPASRLKTAVGEIERVTKHDGNRYICVESWRSEREKNAMINWALTCESYHSPEEWEWLLREFGYQGDLGFIFFT